jgi:hypothetical protein
VMMTVLFFRRVFMAGIVYDMGKAGRRDACADFYATS